MIKSISLQRFKGFKNTTVHLTDFSILMGGNNSGKSSILQAINLLLTSLNKKSYLISWTDGHANISSSGAYYTGNIPGISLSDVNDIFYLQRTRKGRGGGSESGLILSCEAEENIYRLQFTQQFGKNLYYKCVSSADEIKEQPEFSRPLFISGFVGISENEEKLYSLALEDRLSKGRVSSILRNILIELSSKYPEGFQALTKRLKKDFNFNIEKPIFEENKDLNIHSSYIEKIEGNNFKSDYSSLGYGLLQILQILATIYLYCPKQCNVILLDEPDAHLHPDLQKQLLDTLREIKDELGVQIIMATHSIHIIQNADCSEVIPVSKKQDVRPIASKDDLDDCIVSVDSYYLGKAIIRNKVIFIEDRNIDIIKYFDKLMETNIFTGYNSYDIVKGIGKDSKQPYEIKTYLSNKGYDIKVCFVVDRDGLPDDYVNLLKAEAERRNVILYVLDKHEIENYVLKPDLIHTCLVKNNEDNLDTIPSIDKIKEKLKVFYKQEINSWDTNSLSGKVRKCFPSETEHNICVKAGDLLARLVQIDDFNQLEIVAPGKECLSLLNEWLRNELHLNFSVKKLCQCFTKDEVPENLKIILSEIAS